MLSYFRRDMIVILVLNVALVFQFGGGVGQSMDWNNRI